MNNLFQVLRGLLPEVSPRIRDPKYLARALLLIVIGLGFGELMREANAGAPARYTLYRLLQGLSVHAHERSQRTVPVLIENEDYWYGRLAHRTPLKRTYLADLIAKVASFHPAVIGLDVDLTLFGSSAKDDYAGENRALLNALRFAAANCCPVVVTRSLHEVVSNQYLEEPSILGAHYPAHIAGITEGHDRLPDDVRQAPLTLTLKDGREIPSFALAITSVVPGSSARKASPGHKNRLPFGYFRGRSKFDVVTSHDVLSGKLKVPLRCQVVIIGGAWSLDPYSPAALVDSHLTPVGAIPGVLVHANHIEALLYKNTTEPTSEVLSIAVELLFAGAIFLVFELEIRDLYKLLFAGLSALVLIALCVVFWQNMGLFFDFFFPALFVGLHWAYGQVSEWRDSAVEVANLRHRNEALENEVAGLKRSPMDEVSNSG